MVAQFMTHCHEKKMKKSVELFGYFSYSLYISSVMREIPMINELNPLLLDERFDDYILDALMYQPNPEFFGMKPIKDSGKSGSERIYKALKEIERVKGVKL